MNSKHAHCINPKRPEAGPALLGVGCDEDGCYAIFQCDVLVRNDDDRRTRCRYIIEIAETEGWLAVGEDPLIALTFCPDHGTDDNTKRQPECHCGEYPLVHEDLGDGPFTRGLCPECDAGRCDTSDGSCRPFGPLPHERLDHSEQV